MRRYLGLELVVSVRRFELTLLEGRRGHGNLEAVRGHFVALAVQRALLARVRTVSSGALGRPLLEWALEVAILVGGVLLQHALLRDLAFVGTVHL